MQQFETIEYKLTPTRPLKMDIHHATAESRGCIAFLHGGALLIGGREDLPAAVIGFLTTRGWDVAAFDYRVASECSVSEIPGDVRDGCEFLRSRYRDKPLLLCGYSAGAYLALLHGARDNLTDGIIAFAGYGDLGAEWYYSASKFFVEYKNVDYVARKIEQGLPFTSVDERIDLYVYLRQKGLWPEYMFGKKDLERCVAELSPVHHLSKAFPPTVLIHGSEDCDVPVGTSVEMSKALNREGLASELMVLDGYDHDLYTKIEDPLVATAWENAIAFIDKKPDPDLRDCFFLRE